MSYSLQVSAADKAAAKVAVAEKYDSEVVSQQPIHAKDREAVLANVNAAIDLVSDSAAAGKTVHVHFSGSIGWNGTDKETINGVGINCSVHLS